MFHSFLNLMLPSNSQLLKNVCIKFGLPDLEVIQLMVRVLDKEIEINRKIGAYSDQLNCKIDRSMLCPKTKNQPKIIALIDKLQLNLKTDDIICLLRRLDRDQDSDVGIKDWDFVLNRNKVKKCSKNKENKNSSAYLNTLKTKYSKPQSHQTQAIPLQQLNADSQIRIVPEPQASQRITTFFAEICSKQSSIEDIKNDLAMRTDFTTTSGFIYFDLNLDGEIDTEDLRITLLELGLQTPLNYLALIKRFSRTNVLKYCDFQSVIHPKNNSYCQILVNRSNRQEQKQQFTYETKQLLLTLIKQLIKFEDYLRENKPNVYSLWDKPFCQQMLTNGRQTFNELDKDQDGLIYIEDFSQIVNGKPSYLQNLQILNRSLYFLIGSTQK